MNRKRRRAASKAQRGAGASMSSGRFGSKTVHKLFAAASDALKAGRTAEAVTLCDRALAKHSDLAPALKLKGVALNRLGRTDEGIESIRRAIRLKRDVAEFHQELGIALATKGALDDAIAAYREAIGLRSDYAEAHCNLGVALKHKGTLNEAVFAYRQAIALRPAFPEAYNNLASVLAEQGKPREAAAASRQAIKLRPAFPEAHINLGNALRNLGDFEGAVASYSKALELRPNYGAAHYNLTFTYEKWNRLSQAQAAAADGLRAAPGHSGINLVAAICERRTGKPEEALDRLSRVSFDTGDPVVRRVAHFELGQLYDRLGDSMAAFTHFTTANRLHAESWRARVANKSIWHREIDALSAMFTAEWVQSWTPAAPPDAVAPPIFLIGFPRSATTLLGRILDGHPRLHTVVEQPTVAALVAEVSRLPDGYPDALAKFDASQVDRLRTVYFELIDKCAERRPGTTIVDELPLNTVRVGLISRVFPDARFLFAVRHPCDVCLSCFMQNFEINEAMANFLTIEGAAAFYARVMRLWQQYVRLLELDIHPVRYEDLVDNVEAEVRRVLDFAGVDWDSAVLGFAENPGNGMKIKTPSYSQVAEPIYQRAKFRWRRYEDALDPVMETLAPFIEYFGYAENRALSLRSTKA